MKSLAPVQTTSSPSSTTGSNFFLQRKCACGGPAGLSGTCEECADKKLLRQPLQAKLVVGSADDPLEREADQMAEQVMRMPEPDVKAHQDSKGIALQPLVQRKAVMDSHAEPKVPASVHQLLCSPGQPLGAAERQYFEPRFGHDFGHVRVHNNALANASARTVRARAFTVGPHMAFAQGQYSPNSAEGRRLLAHELTHVVQQSDRGPASSEPHRNRNGLSPVDRPSGIRLSTATRLARQPAPQAFPLTLPSEGVEMPWVGKGGTPSSDLGYLRDPVFFWVRFRVVNPASLSVANHGRINNGISPIVDNEWIRAYPQHAAYLGETLEHHHVGQGSKAVPLPSSLHDAHTVFHPQRRVVGTHAAGTKPLPPLPTRSDAQAEIDRHVRAGKIRGQGIAPGTSPKAPAIPPASAVAGVSTQRLAPIGASTPQVPATPAVAVAAPAGSAPRVSSGRQTASAAGVAALAVLIEMIGTALLQSYFAEKFNSDASAKINAAITAFDLGAFLATYEQQIVQAQSEGWEVRIRMAIDTNWQSTDIGNVLMKAKVADCQLLYENRPQPAPYSRSKGGLAGNALRSYIGSTWDSQSITLLLEGTDLQQRRYQKSRAEIEEMLKVSTDGQTVAFEYLLLQGQMGKIPLHELRDYTEHKRKHAQAQGDSAATNYWLSMETLAIGSIDKLIDQAKVKGLALNELRQYALETATVAGESGDRASQHSYHQWRTALRRIDAPLTDQQTRNRQRYLSSKPPSEAELDVIRNRIGALEEDVVALEQQINTLRRMDARSAQERATGEPPYPPWAKIHSMQQKIARLTEEIVRLEENLARAKKMGHERGLTP